MVEDDHLVLDAGQRREGTQVVEGVAGGLRSQRRRSASARV
jgi:hypothetical protein